jgi:hypothetical protein
MSKLPAASGADFLLPIKINNHVEVLGPWTFSGPFLECTARQKLLAAEDRHPSAFARA